MSHDPGAKPSDLAQARKDASDRTREADYKAVKQRCDALSGNAKKPASPMPNVNMDSKRTYLISQGRKAFFCGPCHREI